MVPAINVRFTEEQHQELRTEAFARGTSIQKVVIERIFGDVGAGMVSEEISEQAQVVLPRETPAPAESGAAEVAASPVDTGRSVRRARARSRTPSQEGFKPDFGSKLGKSK